MRLLVDVLHGGDAAGGPPGVAVKVGLWRKSGDGRRRPRPPPLPEVLGGGR